jgi:ketosteroid isomerase-like protein
LDDSVVVADPRAVVASYFAAVTARDAAAVAACFTDDAELVTSVGTHRGRAEIAAFYRDGAFRFDDLRPAPGPLLVDGDRVAVEIELFVDGRTHAVADFFTIAGDRIHRLVIYFVPPSF